MSTSTADAALPLALDVDVYELTRGEDKTALQEALQRIAGFEDAPQRLKRELLHLFKAPEFHVLVTVEKKKKREKKALLPAEILGFATFQMSDVPTRAEDKATANSAVEVIDVFVHRDWRRRGVGKRLVKALEEEARRRASAGNEASWLVTVPVLLKRESLSFWLQSAGYCFVRKNDGTVSQAEIDEKPHLLCDKERTTLFIDEFENLAPLSNASEPDRDLFVLALRRQIGSFLDKVNAFPTVMVCNGGELEQTAKRRT